MSFTPTPSPFHETSNRARLVVVALAVTLAVLTTACGSDADTASGLKTVSVDESAAVLESPPDGLVVLDVRTPEEFDEGHLDGAELLDFYEPDFAARLATLDSDAPYLLYCRSGNRSGQTLDMMRDLGFTDVTEIDGGINAWTAAGEPVSTD